MMTMIAMIMIMRVMLLVGELLYYKTNKKESNSVSELSVSKHSASNSR